MLSVLRSLANAGLVAVERKQGKSPLVTTIFAAGRTRLSALTSLTLGGPRSSVLHSTDVLRSYNPWC
jgi:hypothetical protein